MNGQLGFGFLITGVLPFLSNSLAIKFGKRPVFLVANLVLFLSTVWGFLSPSWASLVAAQFATSAGMAPYLTLVNGTIADLYDL